MFGDSSRTRAVEGQTFWATLNGPAKTSFPRPVRSELLCGFGIPPRSAAFTARGLLSPDLVILNAYVGTTARTRSLLVEAGPAAVPSWPYCPRRFRWAPPFEPLAQAGYADERWDPVETIGSRTVAGPAVRPFEHAAGSGRVRFGSLVHGSWTGRPHSHVSELPREILLYQDPIPAAWDEPFEVTAHLLGEFRKSVEVTGGRLLVSVIPEHFSVHAPRLEALKRGYPSLKEVRFDPDAPARRILSILKARGIDAVDAVLLEAPSRETLISSTDFTPRGTRCTRGARRFRKLTRLPPRQGPKAFEQTLKGLQVNVSGVSVWVVNPVADTIL